MLPLQPSPFLHLLSYPFRQSHPGTPGSSHPLPHLPTHFLSVARWGDWLNCRKGEDSVTPNRVVDRLLSRSPPGNVRQRVVPGAASPGQLNSARPAAGGLRGCLRPPGRGSYTSAGRPCRRATISQRVVDPLPGPSHPPQPGTGTGTGTGTAQPCCQSRSQALAAGPGHCLHREAGARPRKFHVSPQVRGSG